MTASLDEPLANFMAANVDLWMQFNDVYHHALSIPVDTCHRFSVHPLTWLRYLGFTIHGIEGHISALPGGPEVSYFERDNIRGVYYYIAQGESYFSVARTCRSPC